CCPPRMTRRPPVPIPEDERANVERHSGVRVNHERLDDHRMDDSPIADPAIDEKFEAYLKQFRPLAPQPLPVESHVHAPRRWLVFALATAAAAVVAVAVLA